MPYWQLSFFRNELGFTYYSRFLCFGDKKKLASELKPQVNVQPAGNPPAGPNPNLARQWGNLKLIDSTIIFYFVICRCLFSLTKLTVENWLMFNQFSYLLRPDLDLNMIRQEGSRSGTYLVSRRTTAKSIGHGVQAKQETLLLYRLSIGQLSEGWWFNPW